MKKQLTTAKLALYRETLAHLNLDASTLDKVGAGGSITSPCSKTCASLCPCTD
jgi:hypothetical protein